jgi:hypothetical protein
VTSFRTELRDVNSAHNPSKAVSGNLRARAVHRTKITRCVAASVTSCPAVVRFSRVLCPLARSPLYSKVLLLSNNIERLGRQCESSIPILGLRLSFVPPSLLTQPNKHSQGTKNALRACHRGRCGSRTKQTGRRGLCRTVRNNSPAGARAVDRVASSSQPPIEHGRGERGPLIRTDFVDGWVPC